MAAEQPRDVVRQPEPTGTGVIRGRVVTADTGSPVRRANVNLQAGDVAYGNSRSRHRDHHDEPDGHDGERHDAGPKCAAVRGR